MHRRKNPADFFEPIVEPLCEHPVLELVCHRCGFTTTEDSDLARSEYNPELMEDPDNRPYIWDLPEGDCKCH